MQDKESDYVRQSSITRGPVRQSHFSRYSGWNDLGSQ